MVDLPSGGGRKMLHASDEYKIDRSSRPIARLHQHSIDDYVRLDNGNSTLEYTAAIHCWGGAVHSLRPRHISTHLVPRDRTTLTL